LGWGGSPIIGEIQIGVVAFNQKSEKIFPLGNDRGRPPFLRWSVRGSADLEWRAGVAGGCRRKDNRGSTHDLEWGVGVAGGCRRKDNWGSIQCLNI